VHPDFDTFAQDMLGTMYDKAGQAACFIWWSEQIERKQSLTMDEICRHFSIARLPQPNRTRLERDLRRSSDVIRNKDGTYSLSRDGMDRRNSYFSAYIDTQTVTDLVSNISISHCPYISAADITDARKMADIYVSLFCLENSIRRHVEAVLSNALGPSWWDNAASTSMKRKEQERRYNELQNKWIPPRSSLGPLYALDWSDLVTLMRKYEDLFKGTIPDINFLHRFADLGNLRNVIAHNGVIDDPMQFRRIELAMHDWSKQIG
jgi:Swt1-like HEPN